MRPSDPLPSTDHSGIIMQELLTGETDVGFILKCPAIAGISSNCFTVPHHRRVPPPPASARAAGLTPGHCQRAAGAPAVGTGCDELDPAVASAAPGGEPAARHPASKVGAGLALEHGFIPDAGARHHPGSGGSVAWEAGRGGICHRITGT